jgi:type II secretory pathway component GspD/PulD (secretin)
MKYWLSVFCLAWMSLWIPFCNAAEMKLEMIPLQNRNVSEIIPILRPLVHESGTVTGMNNQLIIKTTASNMAELKQVLASIDKAARSLLITVKQDIDGESDTSQHGVSGHYSTKDLSVSSKSKGVSDKGLVISGRDGDGNRIRYQNLSTQSDFDDKNTFTVQTIEGEAAYIQTGQQVPLSNRNTYVTHGGVVVQDTIEYHDVSSGFYVLPRINGDRVTLLVSPQLSRINPDQSREFEVQNAETTAVGRLGEWLEIGAITQQFNSNDRTSLTATRQRGHEQRTIFIKVKELP